MAKKETPPAVAALDPWSRWGTLVALFLALILQFPLDAILHLADHPQGSWAVDIFKIEPWVFVVSLFVAAPPAQVLTKMPRRLGFMETVSLGAVYVLVWTLLLPLALAPTSKGQLAAYDATGLGTVDFLALAAAAYIFPSLDCLLTRPARPPRSAPPATASKAASKKAKSK